MKSLRLPDDKALAALIRGSHVRVAGVEAASTPRQLHVGAAPAAASATQTPLPSRSSATVERLLAPVGAAPALPKPKPPRMNGTETAWAMILEARKRAGEILWYEFEGLRVKLADGAYFTPDFPVVYPDGRLEFQEVKGFWRESARLRIKVAASLYPFWRFYAVRKILKKDGGGWDIEGF